MATRIPWGDIKNVHADPFSDVLVADLGRTSGELLGSWGSNSRLPGEIDVAIFRRFIRRLGTRLFPTVDQSVDG